jgi:uncharacterized Zn-finger protein
MSSDEDEDRKFFRAAAEAIVASSMNNQIDPTIMELLRRIQYASLSKSNEGSSSHTSHADTHANNSSTALSGLIDSTKAANFPTFNLDYFNIQQQQLKEHEEEQERQRQQSAFQMEQQQQSSSNMAFNFPAVSPHAQSLNSKHTPTSQPSFTPNSLGNSTSNPSSPSNGDEKPFQCQDCTLSFRRSSDLRRHQRAHLPVLPHICQQCGKGFARKDALKRHTDTLTCKRNRERLLSSGGDLDTIIHRGRDL